MNTLRPCEPNESVRRADSVSGLRHSARRGFSMVEVVIVMAIVVIVSGYGVLRYSGSLKRYRVDLAARRITSDLAMAQTRARTTSQFRTIKIGDRADAYALTDEASLNDPTKVYRVDLSEEPYKVKIDSVKVAIGGIAVTFDGYGEPDSAAEIVISCGDERRIVYLETGGGRTRVERR